MLHRRLPNPDPRIARQRPPASPRPEAPPGPHLRDEPDPAALTKAIEGLRHKWPRLSTGTPVWPWQRRLGLALLSVLAIGALVWSRATLGVLFAMLAVPFFCVILLRSLALREALPGHANSLAGGGPARLPDEDLPAYSVLVPLLDEAAIVPGLVRGLTALDYPVEKLEILFIVEAADTETFAALRRAPLRDNMQIVVVPDAAPRTKPKALNYALAFATGAYVVVYDAEDVPEPDQLRRAAEAFNDAARQGQRRLGCLQARLNIYNASESWLTRQFTIEYTALFDCILPTLQRYRLPVPLGGTSNHFPRAVLDRVGGWDPFNVTEDADLGIRLARMGWSVGVLGSTTWEEAPSGFGNWKGQRTRWLKGWMQTFLVHMREPGRLLGELGPRAFLGLLVLMGGMLLSALVHPWFYALALADASRGWLLEAPQSLLGQGVWWLGLFNLCAGYATGAALGAAAIRRRGLGGLAGHVLAMPFYWLIISYSAYRALWQLAVAPSPYLWEKTAHTARDPGRMAAAPAGDNTEA